MKDIECNGILLSVMFFIVSGSFLGKGGTEYGIY